MKFFSATFRSTYICLLAVVVALTSCGKLSPPEQVEVELHSKTHAVIDLGSVVQSCTASPSRQVLRVDIIPKGERPNKRYEAIVTLGKQSAVTVPVSLKLYKGVLSYVLNVPNNTIVSASSVFGIRRENVIYVNQDGVENTLRAQCQKGFLN